MIFLSLSLLLMPITFNEMPDKEAHIQIKGFIYTTEEGEQILAEKPNIKSCCLGKNSVKKIKLIPPVQKVSEVAMIEGDLQRKDENEIVYTLINAKLVETKSTNLTHLLLLTVAGVVVYLKKRNINLHSLVNLMRSLL